ncbi:hypothetical protein P4O66_015274 [Electrophorus voltai]|uniref:Complexin-1 n=1 Tax=Electrophorus voltai TaxID=2609070 RepID=A0AAD8YXW0_9TELE|nr:hypothetical protein P4O66_015274 [Electrophorus voltai]
MHSTLYSSRATTALFPSTKSGPEACGFGNQNRAYLELQGAQRSAARELMLIDLCDDLKNGRVVVILNCVIRGAISNRMSAAHASAGRNQCGCCSEPRWRALSSGGAGWRILSYEYDQQSNKHRAECHYEQPEEQIRSRFGCNVNLGVLAALGCHRKMTQHIRERGRGGEGDRMRKRHAKIERARASVGSPMTDIRFLLLSFLLSFPLSCKGATKDMGKMLGEKEEKDPDAEKKEEERQEALRQQEEERKAKYAKMEAERESIRQGIRDKYGIKKKEEKEAEAQAAMEQASEGSLTRPKKAVPAGCGDEEEEEESIVDTVMKFLPGPLFDMFNKNASQALDKLEQQSAAHTVREWEWGGFHAEASGPLRRIQMQSSTLRSQKVMVLHAETGPGREKCSVSFVFTS